MCGVCVWSRPSRELDGDGDGDGAAVAAIAPSSATIVVVIGQMLAGEWIRARVVKNGKLNLNKDELKQRPILSQRFSAPIWSQAL